MGAFADPPHPDDVLDEFVTQLLECGAVLSQIISQLVRHELAVRPDADVVPTPEVAHSLVASVLTELNRRYPRRDLETAAAILKEVTDAICEEIFFVPLDDLDRSGVDGDAGGAGE